MSLHPKILPTNERPLAENGNPIFYKFDTLSINMCDMCAAPLQNLGEAPGATVRGNTVCFLDFSYHFRHSAFEL